MFAALIGPYLVDWTDYRARFEAEASDRLGRPVHLDGRITLRILPTPVVRFTDVTIGDPESPDIRMERFRAEVELAPLLKGEVKVVQARMERPTFDFDVARAAGAASLPASGGVSLDPARVSLGRLEIVGGVAQIADSRSERAWRIDGIDSVIEAATLRGPARIEGVFSFRNRPYTLRGAMGELGDDGRLTVKLSVGTGHSPLLLSTDGSLQFGDAPSAYAGTFRLAPDPTAPKSEARGWALAQAAGKFSLDADLLSLTDIRMSYGPLDRPVTLEGSGSLVIAGAQRFDVAIDTNQIDLDRALGAATGGKVAVGSAFAPIVDSLRYLPTFDIPGTIRFDAKGIVAGGSVIQAVGADILAVPDGWRVETLAALMPGATRIDLEGLLGVRALHARFNGRAVLRSRRPSLFAAWIDGVGGRAEDLDSFSVSADLELSDAEQKFSAIEATIGVGRATGSIARRRFPQSGGAVATIDLRAERMDVGQARGLAELIGGENIGRELDRVELSLSADWLTAGSVAAQSVDVQGSLEKGRLDLRRLAIGDLAGASINATGLISGFPAAPTGTIDANIEAEDLRGAAAALGGLLPESALARRFADVAPSLAPAYARLSVKAERAGEPLSFSLDGDFAGTKVRAEASGTGDPAAPRSLQGSAEAHVASAGSAALLAQLGFPALPVDAGPATIDATYSGALAEGGTLDLRASLAGIEGRFTGKTGLSGDALTLAGDLFAESADVDAALMLAGLSLPGVGEGHALSLTSGVTLSAEGMALDIREASFNGGAVTGALALAPGEAGSRLTGNLAMDRASALVMAAFATGGAPAPADGAWSDTLLAGALPPGFSLRLGITARELDLGLREPARDAEVALSVAGTSLTLEVRQATLAGGSLSAEARLADDEGIVVAGFRGSLKDAALERLVWTGADGPVARGSLDASFDLAGRGHSVSGIVSTTSGSGSFSLAEGALKGLDPGAFAAAARVAEAEIAFEDSAIDATFRSALAGADLPVASATGSFTVENGVVTFSTVSVESPAADIRATATADLNTLRLSSSWNEKPRDRMAAAEFPPQVTFYFRGPIAAPERTVDLGALTGFLRNRVLEKQLAEIEKLQAEVRQREERTRRIREEREAADKAAEKAAAAKQAAEAVRRKAEAEAEQAAEASSLQNAPMNILPPLDQPLDLTPRPAAPPQGIEDLLRRNPQPATGTL